MSAGRAVAAAVLLVTGAARAGAVEDPVAVMPFKNLNADGNTDWLRNGIAETMVSDLKKSGRLKVVERDQIDKALAELALHGGTASEDASAAKVGHLVGAKTVVVGGFQQAGAQLRITARFVTVESGLVENTAKATGTLEGVFALQDEIVARLLGEAAPAGKTVVRARKAPTQRVVTAYRLYAMSLNTSSDADKVQFLKQSIEADPDFSYAVDDLKALEARMAGYGKASVKAATERADQTRADVFGGEGKPEDRARLAFTLLSQHFSAFRYRALLEDAARIAELKLPPYGTMDVREYAVFCLYQAHNMLKQPEAALKTGERYLKEYPGGLYYVSVETGMNALIGQQRDKEEKRKKLPAELEEIARRRAELEGKGRKELLRGPDLQRCSTLHNSAEYRRAVEECEVFYQRYRQEPGEQTGIDPALFRYYVMNSYYELGEFKAARELADKLMSEHPDFARKMSVKMVSSLWPKE